MSTVQPATDLIVVNRGGVDYRTTLDKMSTLQDTDLLLVNRGGVDYRCTAADVKGAVGGGKATVTCTEKTGTALIYYTSHAAGVEGQTAATPALINSDVIARWNDTCPDYNKTTNGTAPRFWYPGNQSGLKFSVTGKSVGDKIVIMAMPRPGTSYKMFDFLVNGVSRGVISLDRVDGGAAGDYQLPYVFFVPVTQPTMEIEFRFNTGYAYTQIYYIG